MADYSVRCGDDVDPYMRNLASEHITDIRKRCNEIAERIMEARRPNAPAIAVDPNAVNGEAHCRFRKLGFHFLLREDSDQPVSNKKREFVLNFATKPKFLPKDMPRRLRKRNGKALSAKPAKSKKKRRVATRLAARQVRRIMDDFLYETHNFVRSAVTAITVVTNYARRLQSVVTNVSQRAFSHARTLQLLLYKAWRRRPRVALPTRNFDLVSAGKELLTRIRKPSNSTPAGAWLERRHFDMSAGFALRLNVLASSEPAIDWESFPFGAPPPPESEQQAS